MTAFPSYAVGTVAVNAGDSTIVGTGPLWGETSNALPGDDIVIGGHTVIVRDVIDDTHLSIDAWPYANVAAGTAYKLYQRSPLRFSGGTAMAIVQQLLTGLNTAGLSIIVPIGAAAPDPSLGEEDQFAIQPSTFKLWLKTGGAWTLQGIFKGFNVTGPYNPATAYNVNDILSSGGSSYIVIAPTTGNAPPNATYYDLLAVKGEVGEEGAPGLPGTNGAGYLATSTTSLAIQTGSKVFTTQEGLAYTVGARARTSSNANGANFMEGIVTAYDGATLTINVARVGGAGTFADWNINVSGEPGSGDLLSTNNLSDITNKPTALNNLSGVSFGAAQALTSPQQTQARGNIGAAATPSVWTRTIITSGSGTYATKAGCKAILVRMVGGGGGGGGGSTSGSAAGSGGSTTFGTGLLTAGGGIGGQQNGGGGTQGGSATGGDINLVGGAGQSSAGAGTGTAYWLGGQGGSSVFGGAGYGGWPSGGSGLPAAANTGGGGGGGGGTGSGTNGGAAGGASGGYVEKLISNPLASYAYAVGAGGNPGGGAAGGSNGGLGGSGVIIIDEFY
jgi:hypothetical protein